MYILVHVDDVIVIGSPSSEVEIVIDQLKKVVVVKDLGELSYFLGIEVKKTTARIHLS